MDRGSHLPGFGHPHRHFRVADSTNARAKELADAGAPGGLVVTAGEQSAGRGRQGRSWFARPGDALLYSALLRPIGDQPLLPLAVPLAVAETAETLGAPDCSVKWPNDVWIGTRKLAGILIESRPAEGEAGWAVIGIGLNLAAGAGDFPEELQMTATSLKIETGEVPTIRRTLNTLNGALGRWVDAGPGAVLAGFRARDALRGRSVSWDGGSGVAEGIGDSGHLLVRGERGDLIELGAGEVHLAVERA